MTPRVLLCLHLLSAAACGTTTVPLAQDDAEGPPSDAAPQRDAGPFDAGLVDAADGDTDAAVVVADAAPREPQMCGGHACACDDGVDSDGDGLVDGLDPECTGPHDDDEASFATGIPSERDDACRDCFWDGNSGFGDGCRYPSACFSSGELSEVDNASCGSCDVSQRCVDSCKDLTPNGCDCFGCCEITRSDGSLVNVLLKESCSLTAVDDLDACPRCIRHPDCRNDCGGCELCPGRRPQDLPLSCRGEPGTSEPSYRCDEGQQVCSADLPCRADFYCQLGCCRAIPQ